MKITTIVLFFILAPIYLLAQNLSSESSTKDTYLFYLHREAIKDSKSLSGSVTMEDSNEFMELSQVFKPYLGHVTNPSESPETWTTDGEMFKSFVLFDLFHSKNKGAGSRDHYKQLDEDRLEEYLDDIFAGGRNYRPYNQQIMMNSSYGDNPDLTFGPGLTNSQNNQAWKLGCSSNTGGNFSNYTPGNGLGESAFIGKYTNDGIVYRGIQVQSDQSYELLLWLTALWNSYIDSDCINCFSVGIEAYDSEYNRLTDSSLDFGPKFKYANNGQLYKSSKSLSFQNTDNYNKDSYPTWDDKCLNFNIPEGVSYIDLHFFVPYNSDNRNFDTGNAPYIFLDDVFLGLETEGPRTNILEDSDFSLSPENSPWERGMLERDYSVYRSDEAFMDGLFNSIASINQDSGPLNGNFPSDPIKVYFSFPDLNSVFEEASSSTDFSHGIYNDFNADLEAYLTSIQSRFNDWSATVTWPANQLFPIEIGGIYLTSERFRSDTELLGSPVFDYLNSIKVAVQNQPGDWKVLGIPYPNICGANETGPRIDSQYPNAFLPDGNNSGVIDFINQQPNAFPVLRGNHANQIVDHLMLDYAHEYIQEKKLGVHIEHHVKDNYEQFQPYHRSIDYLDYGIKNGYVNYRKSFIDDEGDFHQLMRSSDPLDNVVYEEVYKFLKVAEKGHVINSRFETTYFKNSQEILSDWVKGGGAHIPVSSCQKLTSNGDLWYTDDIEFIQGNYAMNLRNDNNHGFKNEDFIPVQGGGSYTLLFDANSDCGNTSINVIIEEYDEQGGVISSSTIQSSTFTSGVWNTDESFTYQMNATTASIKLNFPKRSESFCSCLIDNIKLELDGQGIPSSGLYDETWNQYFPMGIKQDAPGFMTVPSIISLADPIRLSYTSRFDKPEFLGSEGVSEVLNYSIGLRFYDDQGGLIDSSNPSSISANITETIYSSSGVPINDNLVFDYNHAFTGYILPRIQTFYPYNYSKQGGLTFGCSADYIDNSPQESIETWWTSQCIFNEIEIPINLVPAGVDSYRIFFINEAGDDTELIIHRPWQNLETPEYGSKSSFDNSLSIINKSDEDMDKEGKQNYDVLIYPNPASDYFILELSQFNDEQQIEVRVLDNSGREVFNLSNVNGGTIQTIDVSSLRAGIYFVQVILPGIVKVETIEIIK